MSVRGQALRAMSRALGGKGLHFGVHATVDLRRWDGPTVVVVGEACAEVEALRVVGTRRATVVQLAHDGASISTVEHLFAALGAHRLSRGVRVVVEGPELPLLDGGSMEYCRAIAGLNVPPAPSLLRVARDGDVEVGASCFAFRVATETHVSVDVDFGDARIARLASWGGDALDFADRIASARTFALERDLPELARDRLAAYVPPESVVFVGEQIHAAGRPFAPDEPARHKLLDLIGDSFVYGGPAIGHVHAVRPGHAANHAAFQDALASGILVRGPIGGARP